MKSDLPRLTAYGDRPTREKRHLWPRVIQHAQAFWYVLTVILPVMVRTRRRPVIFSRFGGMGDIICTFPAALELKRRHPGAVCLYNCAPSFACLPRMAGVTARVTSFQHIGLVGYWYRRFLSGFYHFSYGDECNHSASTDMMVREFGRRAGVAVGGAHPALDIDAAARSRVRARLAELGCPPGPLILIHPGPSWPVKTWPHESWVALVRELKARGFLNLVQVGASVRSYTNLGAEDFPAIPGVYSLVDRLTLEETTALLSLGDLYIGIDSGLLHIAACVKTPAVGIFGATSPNMLFSESYTASFVTSKAECQGCHHRIPRLHWEKNCPNNIQCMNGIPVAEVLAACLSRLEQPNKG
jgi:ADP-heptose:LPS heptosyltransferase